jgi:hypothetical protein
MFWSQYKKGEWSPRQLSVDKIISSSSVSNLPEIEEFYFWADLWEDGRLYIRIAFEPADLITSTEVFSFNDATDVVEVADIGWGVLWTCT